MNRVLAGEVPKWAKISEVGDEAYGCEEGEGYGYCMGSTFGSGCIQVVGFSNGEGLWTETDPYESSKGCGHGNPFYESPQGGLSNPYSKTEPYKKRRKPISK